MVSNVSELIETKNIINEVKLELEKNKKIKIKTPKIGVLLKLQQQL